MGAPAPAEPSIPETVPFVHLHVHTTYSLLDGACQVVPLVKRAKALGMKALAITDHGNLYGLKAFYDVCNKEGIKPILGCEAYVSTEDHTGRTERSGDHLVLLAKNLTGYHNLLRLISIAHTEGFYYKPRIDKALLERYHEGLIVSSACLAGEVARWLDNGNVEQAEAAARWYQNLFGSDYRLEVMLHHSADEGLNADVYERQFVVNKGVFALAKKLGIPVVATNDVHFLREDDAEAHDILLCTSTGKKVNDVNRLRYTRQEWFKSYDEMCKNFPTDLFPDALEAIHEAGRVADLVEQYKLDSSPIMPVFPIPESFGTEAAYRERFTEVDLRAEFGKAFDSLGGYDKVLRIKFEADYLLALTQAGAAKRWPKGMDEETRTRIDFELSVIKNMGFPGYFLIVQDFIGAAREMGIMVGPGRGSAAGSVVAYCLRITNVNPMLYNLLFERFLNPDRISMPDIDIDFDDEDRGKVLDWVTKKYGTEHVAHIVTFGAMAPKTCIRDVSRVMDVPIPEANRLAALIPEVPKITFAKAYKENPLLVKERDSADPVVRKILELSERLEGSIRQTGVHACGVIISRDSLSETIPVMPTANEELLTTQYDGHFVEPIGLLKMDFLGLKTLSVIKACLESIKESRGETIDIDSVPIDDKETFELFARGETTGLFQFESDGMKNHLRALKPNRFEDLVAMNALYRPGPMDYIPSFIKRKHGKEIIKYDHPLMETYLKDTYGITVYQEQVMLLSRLLGGFTRGESDSMRKAMGKKNFEAMAKLKAKFVAGCLANPDFMKEDICKNTAAAQTLIEKIWGDWEKFANYAFNKSHSVCYAYVAYQTGYLKAHYPAEFMCAQISSEIGNFSKMPALVAEAGDMGLEVKPPDVNASHTRFFPETNSIRYGLGAIKGVGTIAADAIVAERDANGPYRGLIDFCKRLNKNVNKRVLEALVRCGAMDCFKSATSRGQMLAGIDTALARAAQAAKDAESGQGSLFDMLDPSPANDSFAEEALPDAPDIPERDQLSAERELLGIYLSGHPLNRYRRLVHAFRTCSLASIATRSGDTNVRVVAQVNAVAVRISKKSKEPWATLSLDDNEGVCECLVFPNAYRQYSALCVADVPIVVCGHIDRRENDVQLIADELHALTDAPTKFGKGIVLDIPVDNDHSSEERLDALRQVLSQYPGGFPVTLRLGLPDGIITLSVGPHYAIAPTTACLDALSALLGKNAINYVIKPGIGLNERRERHWKRDAS